MFICEKCGNEIEGFVNQCPYCGYSKQSFHIHSKKTQKKFKSVNIKQNLPSVDEARFRLQQEIDFAKSCGIKILKIIHGYGSSGQGGKLRNSLRQTLVRMKNNHKISSFITGEDFFSNSENFRKIKKIYPKIQYDPDLNKSNKGITIIIL